jgi:hypothetical protein
MAMRTNIVFAALCLVFAGTVVAASCVSPSAAEPIVETRDDGDPFGSDPDVGGSIGGDVGAPQADVAPSSSDISGDTSGDASGGSREDDRAQPAFMNECKTACLGGPRAMAAWCTLLQYHPDATIARDCWDHVHSSKPVCMAWCAWVFVLR